MDERLRCSFSKVFSKKYSFEPCQSTRLHVRILVLNGASFIILFLSPFSLMYRIQTLKLGKNTTPKVGYYALLTYY